ncbi:hypothetical protein EDD85DRAFT_792981 [Armillaria nabsnona]|nr:hypothetical protein EDD85DRAFT_792981 [Armillaria nabsnona]
MADEVIKVTTSDWPSFLYCQEEHVKDDLESGLMKGYLLLWAQYALSSKDTWLISDGAVHIDMFYDVIVDLFEKYLEDEWTVDTLKWWNDRQIFGDPKGFPEDVDDRTNIHLPESSVQTVSDAHEACAKAHAEAAATAAALAIDEDAAGDEKAEET